MAAPWPPLPPTSEGTPRMFERIGTAGHVAGYDVLILADAVIVTDRE